MLFEPSVAQPISQTAYDLNNELLVHYSSHGLNNELLVRYSGHGLNNEPFDERTVLDHSNTKLVRYSGPHCIKVHYKIDLNVFIPLKNFNCTVFVCPVLSIEYVTSNDYIAGNGSF